MKVKHNKKRNTAFVYEALINEATVAVLKDDFERSKKVVDLVRKHFTSDSNLKRDLECYKSLYENQSLETDMSHKILKEANISKRMIDPDGLFDEQTSIINDVNKNLTPSVFNNFVPNYKSLATINKMFNTTSPKEKVILETKIIENMSASLQLDDEHPVIDNIVYKTFVDKFNQKYQEDLLDEQKYLLSHYISSFTDNSIELKMFLNEEIGRLKEKLEEAKNIDEIKSDTSMSSKADKIISKLNSYSQETISENVIMTVLKTQQLVKEIHEDGRSS
jgi:hypothetical protein